MSLPTSTVFSQLTSTLSSSPILSSTSSEEENTTNADDASTTPVFTIDKSTTGNSAFSTLSDVTSTSTTTIANISFSSESRSSDESNFNNYTTSASVYDEEFLNETSTSIDINNSSTLNSSSLGFNNTLYNSNNGNSSSNFTNDLEFQDWEEDASNNSLYTSTDYSTEDFGEVSKEPTTYVPLFYFLLTIVLGIYVFLYFLQRHLKAKAARVMEDDQKKRVEERIKRGGCRYDFEDDEESDYGPPEQNLSVAALRFYGGGSRK